MARRCARRSALVRIGSIGPAIVCNTLAAGEESGEWFATAIGCADPATVVGRLRKAWPGTMMANQRNYLGAAKVSGALLPVAPADALGSGTWNSVAIMNGTPRSEYRLTSGALFGITAQGYVDRVNARYGATAAQVLALYPLSRFKSAYDALTQVTTDAARACNSEVAAKLYDSQGPYTYGLREAATISVCSDRSWSAGDRTRICRAAGRARAPLHAWRVDYGSVNIGAGAGCPERDRALSTCRG